jgi:antitoxin HigA-1
MREHRYFLSPGAERLKPLPRMIFCGVNVTARLRMRKRHDPFFRWTGVYFGCGNRDRLDAIMSAKAGVRMKNPAHPGGFVRSEIVEALDLSVTDAAKALGVARPALSALLNERAALSPEMALRIEKAFGVSMDTLMRMQNSYDIAQARRRAGEIKVARFIAKPGDPSPALT